MCTYTFNWHAVKAQYVHKKYAQFDRIETEHL